MRFRKVILAVLCFILAGFVSFWIKELIDARNPSYAVPRVTVTADGRPVSAALSECSWSFLTQETYTVDYSGNLFDMDIPRNDCMGGEKLEIQYSQPTDLIRIYRTLPYTYDFIVAEDELIVPYEAGGYIYQVYAQFPRGYEVILFYIVVGN